ncbi:hypothetical protein B7494_g4891 [Chlorociboria aeruginascens]|nr:hypothetical protein B7494_g4891 [Chlorociboria aeruginascens]
MKFSLGLVSLVLALPNTLALNCGLRDTYDYDILNNTDFSELRIRDTTYIDLWVHFLVSSPAQADALVSGTGLYAQLKYLNANYAPWGFQFTLKPFSVAINSNWASSIDADQANKMSQLHRGDYSALNVYAVEGATSGVCSLPIANTNAVGQTDLDGDGCWIPITSATHAPDGTMTHEIGHWFSLLHPFQGGCTTVDDGGDFCADTPAQAGPSYGHMATPGDFNSCGTPDTCPDLPGTDNVQNFMDYTDCSEMFTPNQGARMLAGYNTYRAGRAIQAGVLWK